MQLNLYRYILEDEFSFVVSGMYLGIAHPLRSRPLCLEIPRLETEIALLVDSEASNVPLPPHVRSPFRLSMARCVAFVRLLSDESGVSQQDCKKVLDGLSKVLVKAVKESGCCRIPNVLIVRKVTKQATQGGEKKAFGKIIKVPPRPERHRVRITALKKFKDSVLPA